MKILWIEDFGDRFSRSEFIEEMFGELFKDIDLSDHYHEEDTDTAGQLSRLFAEHTLHEIQVCKSYLDWKSVDAEHRGDFDIALIDINLESSPTPNDMRPPGIDNPNFDKQAGFYIYHQLIKRGFPDDNIAFFTAQGQSLKEFAKYCGDIFLDRPAHCFQKNPTQFKQLRRWLAERTVQQSLILRRGVIEGCRFMRAKIDAMGEADLRSLLIFYKTIPGRLNDGAEALRRDSLEYLTRLERFFFVHRNYDDAEFRRSFTLELAAKWEESYGVFIRAKEAPQFESWLENQFYRAAQVQMKTLRNWSSHRQLSSNLTPKELAYFFMLAMRALVETNLSEVHRYEEILSTLFTQMSDLELKREMNSGFEFRLEHSYEQLKALHTEVLRHVDESSRQKMRASNYDRRMENYFLTMVREMGEAAKYLKFENRKDCLGKMKEVSLGLFYDGFWHGLFPLEIKTTYYANLQKIKFDIQPLPPSFISFLGRSIFAECFKVADAAVLIT
jgi:hypothetical protein